MLVQYTLEAEKYNKLVEEKVIEGVDVVDTEEYNIVEISVDFIYNTVSVWGNSWGTSTLLNDYATVNNLEKLEDRSEIKEVDDIYVTNIEIAQYLEAFDIPHEWALEAVDEWRSPEEEEEELEEKEFWEAMDGIKTAYQISREEN